MKKNEVEENVARLVESAKRLGFQVGVDVKTFTGVKIVVPTADMQILETRWYVTLELSALAEVS